MPATHEQNVRRFRRKFVIAFDGCWAWRPKPINSGYGIFFLWDGAKKTGTLAHRFAYETWVGPIPEGLTIDHLCRNKLCVNPSHLEPVSNAENNRRGNSLSAQNSRKTRCKRGHEFTPENTEVQTSGARKCKTCRKAANRDRYAANKAKVRRGERVGSTKDGCGNGHKMTPENTYWSPSGPQCRECKKEAARRFRARHTPEGNE